MLLLIERGGDRRVRGMDMPSSVDDPISSTARDAHEYRIEGRVEVYFVSLDAAPVLNFEESSVGC